MRLNKQAAWGPLPTVVNAAQAAPNSLRSSLATQSPLTGKIDELKTAIAAGNPNAALTALAQPLQGLQQLQQLQQLQNLQGLQNLQALAGLPQALAGIGTLLQGALQQLGTDTAAALGQVRDSIDGLAEAVREVDVPDVPDHEDEPDPPGELGVRALALLAPLHAALCNPKAKPGPVATPAQRDKAEKLAVEIAEIDPQVAEDFVEQFRDLELEGGHSLDAERAERLAELIGVEWRLSDDLDEDPSA